MLAAMPVMKKREVASKTGFRQVSLQISPLPKCLNRSVDAMIGHQVSGMDQ